MLFLLSYKIILSNDTRSNTVVLFCECSEWMLVFNAKRTFVLSWREQGTFRWLNDNIHFVLDQHSYLDLYSAGTQQQSAGGYVAPFGHIILISSQPVFALTPYWCMLSVEATNTNFTVIWIDTIEARTPTSTPLEASMLTSMNESSIISWLAILNLNGSVLNI